MDVLRDFFILTFIGLKAFGSGLFFVYFLGAIILSILCYLFCNYYTRFWNKKYRITVTYQILSGIASFFTFVFVLTLIGFSQYKYVVEANIANWAERLKTDQIWKREVMKETYFKVKDNGLEDFTNFQNPEGSIPVSKPESKQLVAGIISSEACMNFKKVHPFLAKFAWTKSEIPSDILKADLDNFFSIHKNATYSSDDAINLVAKTIKADLIMQIPRVVRTVKLIIILSFLIIELIPFGLIGIAAYKNLEIKT